MRLSLELGASFLSGYVLCGLLSGSIKAHVTREVENLRDDIARTLNTTAQRIGNTGSVKPSPNLTVTKNPVVNS
jgi:hypothetical protein